MTGIPAKGQVLHLLALADRRGSGQNDPASHWGATCWATRSEQPLN